MPIFLSFYIFYCISTVFPLNNSPFISSKASNGLFSIAYLLNLSSSIFITLSNGLLRNLKPLRVLFDRVKFLTTHLCPISSPKNNPKTKNWTSL